MLELLRRLDSQGVPKVLVNRERVCAPGIKPFVACLLGSCDEVLAYVSSRLEWEHGKGVWDVAADPEDATMFRIKSAGSTL